jgi:prepilin-type N-terminal cleavage/methylation domain-containing protein
MLFNKTAHTKALASQRGFTIVELLVTLGIVVLVTGIVMLRYSSFNSSVLLTSQAYLTAFDVREAQSLAISVRGNSNQFREEYGLYFNMADPNEYLLFQDNEANGDHSPARFNAGEEIGVPYKVDSRFTILNICGTNGTSRTCYTDDPETADESIDSGFDDVAISFKRPDFDARFYSPDKSNMQMVEIHIGNEDSVIIKKVVVYSSGQISIE